MVGPCSATARPRRRRTPRARGTGASKNTRRAHTGSQLASSILCAGRPELRDLRTRQTGHRPAVFGGSPTTIRGRPAPSCTGVRAVHPCRRRVRAGVMAAIFQARPRRALGVDPNRAAAAPSCGGAPAACRRISPG
ncbi:hypothetical protein HBB16_06905 [Pseudonocardia sp. MCCB 268]|nr:hypothetical protein [Pseudonocardia cytotoxica]